jgi:hypothetical protein
MIWKLLAAWCLLGLTVAIDAAGLSAMLPGIRSALPERRFWPESSSYSSALNYTPVGYGDLVLPQEWRLVGAVEGLTGSKCVVATPASEQD